jgi:hypothetical protein
MSGGRVLSAAKLAQLLVAAGLEKVSASQAEAARVAVNRETSSIVRYLTERSRTLLAHSPEQALTLSFHAGCIAGRRHGDPSIDDPEIEIGQPHLFAMLSAEGIDCSGENLDAARAAVRTERSGVLRYLNIEAETAHPWSRADGQLLGTCAHQIESGLHEQVPLA